MSRRGKAIGKWGEDLACQFLIRNGFVIKTRNFYTTVGEIDIVAVKNGDFYFVEVKTRYNKYLADTTAITPVKIKKMSKTMSKYCFKHNLADVSLILAGLIVSVDKTSQKVNFFFSVIH